MKSTASRAAAQSVAPKPRVPSPNAPSAFAVTDGAETVGTVVKHDRAFFAFDGTGNLLGKFATCLAAMRSIPPISLTKRADALLRSARCDVRSGAKKDKRYRRNERAKGKRLARRRRAQIKKLGKFGAASPVRNVAP